MCYIWLDRVIRHGAKEIIIFYEDFKPKIVHHFKSRDVTIQLEHRTSEKGLGSNHFNIRFKLPTLASLDFPFIFLDSDMYVIHDLDELWELKDDKPWIGVDHQRIPSLPDTHRKPFLNSGLQIVSDPSIYKLDEIIRVQKAAGYQFMVPGRDQALLFRYFKHIEYDYTHPKVGPEWNSCSKVGELVLRKKKWSGHTKGLKRDHKVFINHYWNEHKPWKIKCPMHRWYSQKTKL
jgi:hypothetical protein